MAAKEAVVLLRNQLGSGSTGCGARALFSRHDFINTAALASSRPGTSALQLAQSTSFHTKPHAPSSRRLFSSSSTIRARLVDDQHVSPAFGAREPHHPPGERDDGIWACLAGETARALWRQAKARVEAEERQRYCRAKRTNFVSDASVVRAGSNRLALRLIRTTQRTWRPAAFRSCPHWRAKQRCSHGWPWGKRGDRPFGHDKHAHGSRRKKDGSRSGAHMAPVAGCRPSGPGWGWYLAVNERRRRDPTRRAEFRHVYRTLHPYAPDPGAEHFSMCRTKFQHHRVPSDIPPEYRVPSSFRVVGPKRFRRSRAEHYASRDRAFRCVKRILLRFCAESPNNSWRRSGHHARHPGWSRSHRQEHSRGRRSLYNVYQGRHEFVDRRRPFQEGKKGAGKIQVGVGTDEYRAASIMSVHAATLSARPRIHLARSRPRLPFAERIRSARASPRAFSTTAARGNPLVNMLPAAGTLPCAPVTFCPLELALPLLVPLATILKSSAALNCLAAITRISLTLLPLSVRGKILHTLRERYLRDPASISSSIWSSLTMRAGGTATLETPSSFLTRWNAMVGLPLLLLTPLFMLALVAIASLERTPITGRWRIVMLSPAEEAELVDSVLSAGPAGAVAPAATAVPEGTSRDWVQILRQVLQLPNEGVAPATRRRILLGGEVLDQRDWRVRWTEAVLVALQKSGLGTLDNNDVGSGPGSQSNSSILRPPPTDYPLEPRPEALSHQEGWRDELLLAKPFEALEAHRQASGRALALDYDLLVIENDAVNAFSFGFGPGPAQSTAGTPLKRGVIVVYTGFLREILGCNRATSALASAPPAEPPAPRRSLLGGLKKTPSTSASKAHNSIAANLVPPTLPTDSQTKALAVLLSHELAHLALSHTLESYASTSLLLPHLARLTTDGASTGLLLRLFPE